MIACSLAIVHPCQPLVCAHWSLVHGRQPLIHVPVRHLCSPPLVWASWCSFLLFDSHQCLPASRLCSLVPCTCSLPLICAPLLLFILPDPFSCSLVTAHPCQLLVCAHCLLASCLWLLAPHSCTSPSFLVLTPHSWSLPLILGPYPSESFVPPDTCSCCLTLPASCLCLAILFVLLVAGFNIVT